jgi:hypothetical protein
MIHQLPALLPPTQTTGPFPLDGQDLSSKSRNQIKKVLDGAPKVYWNGDTQITRIANDVVVKHGADVQISEANNMKYVHEHSTIQLPKLIDAWEENENELATCYIVMQYIEGSRVSEIWPDLSEEARNDINRQLYDFVRQL